MTTVDVGADLLAHLHATLGGIHAELTASREDRDSRRRREARMGATPVFMRFANTTTVNAGGVAVVSIDPNLQGPDQGHIWEMKAVRMAGVTPASTLGGTGDLFVASRPPVLGSEPETITSTEWVDHFAAMPAGSFYSQGQMIVKPNELIWATVAGGTNGQIVVANMLILDYEEAAYAKVFAL